MYATLYFRNEKLPFFETDVPCSSFPLAMHIYFDETSPAGKVDVHFYMIRKIKGSISIFNIYLCISTKLQGMSL